MRSIDLYTAISYISIASVTTFVIEFKSRECLCMIKAIILLSCSGWLIINGVMLLSSTDDSITSGCSLIALAI